MMTDATSITREQELHTTTAPDPKKGSTLPCAHCSGRGEDPEGRACVSCWGTGFAQSADVR